MGTGNLRRANELENNRKTANPMLLYRKDLNDRTHGRQRKAHLWLCGVWEIHPTRRNLPESYSLFLMAKQPRHPVPSGWPWVNLSLTRSKRRKGSKYILRPLPRQGILIMPDFITRGTFITAALSSPRRRMLKSGLPILGLLAREPGAGTYRYWHIDFAPRERILHKQPSSTRHAPLISSLLSPL